MTKHVSAGICRSVVDAIIDVILLSALTVNKWLYRRWIIVT